MKKLSLILAAVMAGAVVFADAADDALKAAAKLRKERKNAEALQVLEKALPDVPDAKLRAFMNEMGRPWRVAPATSEKYLKRALLAESKIADVRARTYEYLGISLLLQKKYAEASENFKLGLLEQSAHPAILMSMSSYLSTLSERAGNKADALKYCRSALKHGRNIRYKVNLKPLEARLAKLEKENKK